MTKVNFLRQSEPPFRKRATPTRPFFRASATATTGTTNSTTLSITIPSGAVVGDWAFMVVTVPSNTTPTLTTPTGWTLCPPSPYDGSISAGGMPGSGNCDNSASVRQYVFYKVIATGNPGSSVTITCSSSQDLCASMAVYGGVGCISTPLVAYSNSNTETINSRPMRSPSTNGGPNDLMVGFVSNYAYSSTGPGNSNVTAAPSGRTLRGVSSSAPNIISFAHCAAIFDGTASNQYETYTIAGGQAHTVSSALTLGPIAGAIPAEVSGVPASLVGKGVVTYGTSICCDVPRAETNTGFTTVSPWPLQIQNAYGNVANSNNMGMCGSMVVDQCCAAYGTQSVPTQAPGGGGGGSGPPVYTQMVNYTNWLSGHTAPGLILWDPWGNDWLNEATISSGMARQRTAAALAADAMVRLFRAASVKDCTDASFSFTGSWSSVTSIGYHGGTTAGSNGTAKLTTTPGDKFTITATGTDFDVILIAEDNSANATTGATYSVKVDGVSFPIANRVFAVDSANSITTQFTGGVTHNQTVSSKGGGGLFSTNYTIYKFCQLAVPIRGLSSGSHTIEFTHTGSSGDRLLVNCYLVPATGSSVPWICMNGLTPFPDATYGTYNPGNTTTGYQNVGRANLAVYQAMTNAIAAQFPDNKVITFDPSSINFNFTPNASPGTGGSGDFMSDGVHGLETWHAIYTKLIMRRIYEVVS
ncbi:MAG: hypothetical protein ACM3UO_00320 [Bacillota bacterium]